MLDTELLTEEMQKNGEFFTNNCHINKPYNHPDRAKKILVRSKEDGSVVALDRWKDFSPKFHSKMEAPKVGINQAEELKASRLKELRDKVATNKFFSLSPNERAEFKKLKDYFNEA